MEIDKVIALLGKFGFPTFIAVWFLYKIQIFLDALIAQNATVIELLRQLIQMHAK